MRRNPAFFLLASVGLAFCLPAQAEGQPKASVRALVSGQDEWRWATLSGSSGVPAGRVVAIENDGDGKKAEWRKLFRQKLEELTVKEEGNRLSNMEKRNPAYKVIYYKHRNSLVNHHKYSV